MSTATFSKEVATATRSSLRAYSSRSVMFRVTSDIFVCAIGIAICIPLGFQQAWTAHYFGAFTCAWVMSDFASNLLFLPNDRAGKEIAIGHRGAPALLGENLALASWLLPFGVIVTVAACASTNELKNVDCAIAAVFAVLGSWFGVGDVVSVMAPRVPLGIKAAKGGPKAWREQAGRGVAYFGTMFVFGPLASLPAYGGFYYALYHQGTGRLVALLIAFFWSVVVWAGGYLYAVRRMEPNRERIAAVVNEMESP